MGLIQAWNVGSPHLPTFMSHIRAMQFGEEPTCLCIINVTVFLDSNKFW